MISKMQCRRIFLTALCIFSFFLSAKTSLSQRIVFHPVSNATQFDSILEIAQKQGRPLFAEFFSASCHWCRQSDTTTMRDSALLRFLNESFICAKVNLDSDFGMQLINRYKIFSLPAFVMLDERGKMIYRLMGAQSAASIISDFRPFIADYPKFLSYNSQFRSNRRNPDFLMDYAFLLLKFNQRDDARMVANICFNSMEEPPLDSRLWRVVSNTMFSDEGRPLSWVCNHYSSLTKIFGFQSVNNFLDSSLTSLYNKAVLRKDTSILHRAMIILDVVTDSNGNNLGSEREKDLLKLNYYYGVEDWTAFVRSSSDFILNYRPDPDEVRNIVYIICDHVTDPDHRMLAVSWARALWEKDKSFDNYLCYANSCLKGGDRKKADKLIKKAEKMVLTETQKGELLELKKQIITGK